MSKRILLVDDHKILRDGLRSLLENHLGYRVVGEAEDGKSAIQLARKLKPEVVIMDISLPDITGIEASKEIIKTSPTVKIIALSMHSDKRFVSDMLRAGASGYLLKDCAFEELQEAIETVSADGKYISPNLTGTVINAYVENLRNRNAPPPASLSEREQDVLIALVEGSSSKDISYKLHISTKTVDTYRQRIMEKLNIHNIPDLVKYAIREGLIRLDE